jgi:hypothetical protein
MSIGRGRLFLTFFLICATAGLKAQIYSPAVLHKGQVDTSNLAALARTIYKKAGAVTDREKAEAIWRFFLTDGRFVKPGFWYHIAGWAYEEPQGEVLDPLKLLNSYGFGLCYHIAPLLEAVWEAGGFPDARVWFLTGHTVTEVFYDGAYHYYDSDMMGYNTIGNGDPRHSPVASVHQIERNGDIILGKLTSPKEVNKSLVDYPWYPADLREAAIGGLAELFTTTSNNWLYPCKRYPQGHTMDFVLRPGERLIRYFEPGNGNLCYVPYKFVGGKWEEFPREFSRWNIRTVDGPKSQKDGRRWATGRIEYTPVLSDRTAYYPSFGVGFNENLHLPGKTAGAHFLTREKPDNPGRAVFEVRSPYVIIDANVVINASLKASGDSLVVETSTDNARTWQAAGALKGPYSGRWQTAPEVVAHSQHATHTAVSGSYGYLLRLSMLGPGPADAIAVDGITITTRFQLNPRTLPALEAGRNELLYRPGPAYERRVIPVRLERVEQEVLNATNVRHVEEDGQGYLMPRDGKTAEFIFELSAPGDSPLIGFDAGGRFLEIEDSLAPDKLTAEVRKTSVHSTTAASPPKASLSWSTSENGNYSLLWQYEPPQWRDGQKIDRTLRWPEVDRNVRSLPSGTKKVYVRYRIQGIAIDDLRLAVLSPGSGNTGHLEITHVWRENGQRRTSVERIANPRSEHEYIVETGPASAISNEAVIFSCSR